MVNCGLVVITFFAAIIVGQVDGRTAEGQTDGQTEKQMDRRQTDDGWKDNGWKDNRWTDRGTEGRRRNRWTADGPYIIFTKNPSSLADVPWRPKHPFFSSKRRSEASTLFSG